jgi:hypothetical protein
MGPFSDGMYHAKKKENWHDHRYQLHKNMPVHSVGISTPSNFWTSFLYKEGTTIFILLG